MHCERLSRSGRVANWCLKNAFLHIPRALMDRFVEERGDKRRGFCELRISDFPSISLKPRKSMDLRISFPLFSSLAPTLFLFPT
jgi:hypothetical protein